MAREVFNRFEHKYLLDGDTYEKITKVMEEHMVPDSYNIGRKPYTIANVYYDTSDDYLIRKSLSKPVYKEKIRLRSYGVPDMDTKVFFEIKKKYKGIVNKRRTKILLSDAYDFAESGEAKNIGSYMNLQVMSEITYFFGRFKLYPKLYLAYDRIAYFEEGNPDLRISFDKNIRSRRYDVALEKGDYGEPVLPHGIYLMEVKTSLAKPLWLTEALTELGLSRVSFSKYGTEFKNNIA